MGTLRIAFVSSEVAPWSKTGGLGDVGGALPRALRDQEDLELAVFTPLYRSARQVIEKRGLTLEPVGEPVQTAGGPARFLELRGDDGPRTLFFDAPHLFDRAGIYGPASTDAYTDAGKGAFDDNLERFAAFCEAVVAQMDGLLGGRVDALHLHDWQAALGVALVGADTPTILTIHNLAYQGAFPVQTPAGHDLDDSWRSHGYLNLLHGAIANATVVSTVSPTYAKEITTPEFGCGLDGLLQWRGVTGILNGIDERSWDPSVDPELAANFSAEDRAGRAACRRALLAEFSLPDEPGTLLLGVVSRLAGQKAPELIVELVPRLGSLRSRLVLLGSGDKAIEAQLAEQTGRFYLRLGTHLGFDAALARRIYAGVDAVLVPSRFEPCGLVQLYAMRYGAVPIASAVGGLVDTVEDPGDDALAAGEGTGVLMDSVTSDGLATAVARAADLYRDHPEAWSQIQQRGMARDWSWAASAAEWAALYRRVAAG